MSTTQAAPPVTTTDRIDSTRAPALPGVSQIVCFRLGEEEYGVDILCTQEILTVPPITRVPAADGAIRGLIHVRGQIIALIDLRVRLGMPECQLGETTRIVVVKWGEQIVGMLVDAVTAVLRIRPNEIEPPPGAPASLDAGCVGGLVRLPHHLVILLNVEAVLSPGEAAEGKRGGR
jgi:purine-binding chemotaxis protein CheW